MSLLLFLYGESGSILFQPTNLAVSAFDHPTLFDAVCSPTFGQILQPQPANGGQSNTLIQPMQPLSPNNQSNSLIQPLSPSSQSNDLLKPVPVVQNRQSLSPTHISPSPSQTDSMKGNSFNFGDSIIESEDLSDVYNEEVRHFCRMIEFRLRSKAIFLLKIMRAG